MSIARPVNPQPLPRAVRTKDAAYRLAVAPSTIYRWMERGMIETVVLPNGAKRVTARAIDTLLDAETDAAMQAWLDQEAE